MKRILIVVLVLLATGAQATYLIGRNGAVLKPFQVFAWLNASYGRSEKSYNWDSTKYVPLAAASRIAATSAELSASVGLPGKLELGLTVPLFMKARDTFFAAGPGDVMIHARYGILQSKLLPVKLAATLGVNVPTSDKDANPALGDRTIDAGLGLAAVTSSLGKVTLHGRAGYWLNGKTNDTTKVGNLFEYIAVADYAVCKCFIPELALSGTVAGQRQVHGTAVPHSESSIHNVGLLLMFKPLPMLVVRPKVSVPLEFASKGASLAPYTVGLDVWATFP